VRAKAMHSSVSRLLTPAARGLGLGSRLTDECIAFARTRGYRKMVLWTNSCLTAARGIYAQRGFQLVKTEPYEGFWSAIGGRNLGAEALNEATQPAA